MENKKEIFVIRPSKKINIPITIKDKNKIQEVYDMGVSDCIKIINNLNYFLEQKNIQVDNTILVCLIIFLILQNETDFILFIILGLLIF